MKNPDPVLDDRPAQCSKRMGDEGKPYPRTCLVCGLGPCHGRGSVVHLVDLQPPTELEKASAQVHRNLDLILSNAETLAKIRRAAYEAYRKEGFTEQQALELCKS